MERPRKEKVKRGREKRKKGEAEKGDERTYGGRVIERK